MSSARIYGIVGHSTQENAGDTMGEVLKKRGKEPSGAIVKRAAPLEHTAASLAAFDYLVALWGMTHQATIRRALEEAARAAYWPGPQDTGNQENLEPPDALS